MICLILDCMVVCVFLVLVVLIGVAFFTMLERKVLGYGQLRKGPNSVGFIGLLQPISDALKLFSKEYGLPFLSNWFLFLLSPFVGFVVSLFLWLIFPISWYWFDFIYGLLFFFCVSSMGVYFVAGSGWFSNSKYALLGSYRAVAQMISYEVSMILLILFLVLVELFYLIKVDVGFLFWYGVGYYYLLVMWLICCLAETNRSPLDFAEAESELVSGFNVEYGSGGFAMIFMSEYGSIMLMSLISGVYFFGGFFLFFFVVMYFFLWSRVTLPRLRYDKLMLMIWSVYLPCSLNLLVFIIGFCYLSY